jgi:phosphoribosyl-ATP pyrophosphohydrolase
MILPILTIPGNDSQLSFKSEALLAYLQKVGYLGPALLNCKAASVCADLLTACVSSKASCMLTGLKPDEDEFVTSLLDQGLRVAFFEQVENQDKDEAELQTKVLGSFPRSRVGVSTTLNIENISSVDMSSKVKQKMEETVSSCADRAMSMYFEVTVSDASVNGNIGEAEKMEHSESLERCLNVVSKELATHAKALVKDFEKGNKGKRLMVYLHFNFPGVRVEEALAAEICTIMRESVHVAINSKMLDFQGREQFSPYCVSGPSNIFAYFLTGDSSQLTDILGVYIKTIVTDRPDGMYATVVCDEHNKALGLVYSNEESLRTAVTEGKGIYWSRSRQSLWRKGETSGMHQELVALTLDCDGDALRFTVIQHGSPGAFCHLNTRTCWGEDTGVNHLQTVLQDRFRAAPPGSYTKRLFDDPSLLQKKLLEEVQELVEAEEPDHIAAEAADVTYFMMVRCIAGGVGLADIEKHLDKRALKVTRRPGNAKEWRSEKAAALLGDQKAK